MKAERPVGTQLFGQGKKEPAKAGESTAKAQSPKAPSKKARQKPQEPKKVFRLHSGAKFRGLYNSFCEFGLMTIHVWFVQGKGGKAAAKH
ncbi:hypothetical protein L484_025826 [Morus notabilis]|uniref:Uncharacterized protein n=1 Tax=Morus notabilis TaxID=981085 RepID=W9RD06_9ROSA|nr:hypothetical protein L484_025826 [Morus notabilis]